MAKNPNQTNDTGQDPHATNDVTTDNQNAKKQKKKNTY